MFKNFHSVQPTLLENLAITTMAKTKKQKTFRWMAYKPLLATALAFAGVFNMVSVVLAEGTAAGTGISNTATATYGDGSVDPITGDPTTFDAISNTVTVSVAEVAGITVVASGQNDVNDGSLVTNDVATFDFRVTNTGNADSFVFVPGANNIAVANGNILRVDIVDPGIATVLADSTDPTVAISSTIAGVDADGASTADLITGGTGLESGPGFVGTGATAGTLAPDEFITVRVTVQATGTALGDDILVQFGNTFDDQTAVPPTGTQNLQNIPDLSEDTPAARADDVRTLNEGATTPVNGEREAADSATLAFAAAANTEVAQALVQKFSTYNDNATTANPNDDTIAYTLSLDVGNAAFAGLTPGNLEGTNISVDRGSGAAIESRILVSDAIPVNTVFDASVTPSVPSANWEVVYSTNDPAVTGDNALEAAWTTAQPTTASDIKRIGFIYDAGANGALAPLASVTGFGFTVSTTGLPTTAGTNLIANIGQVFGETEGDALDNVVFDESGDQQINNLGDGVPLSGTSSTFTPGSDLGIANELDPETTPNANDGDDTDPDSTSNGESNVVTITVVAIPNAAGDLVNGPNGVPGAFGPDDGNDDFTNVSTPQVDPADVRTQDATDGNPAAITITNQVQLLASAASFVETTTLLPLAPSVAENDADQLDNGVIDASAGDYGLDADLPDNTTVTITFGGQSAEYNYTAAGGFAFVTSTGTPTAGGPVVVGRLDPGDTESYTVTVDLPAGTPQVRGYGIPIAAFVDNDGNGAFDSTSETLANITIDRVYTGFMTLLKEARVQGPRETGGPFDSGFLSNAAALAAIDVLPGDTITYRITYDNISEAATGATAGSILLNANNFTLIEDGNAATNTGTNNWASNTFHVNGAPLGSAGTMEFLNGATTLGATDPATETVAPSAVTVYRNEVGTVTPADAAGTLEFIREVE